MTNGNVKKYTVGNLVIIPLSTSILIYNPHRGCGMFYNFGDFSTIEDSKRIFMEHERQKEEDFNAFDDAVWNIIKSYRKTSQ